MKKCSKCKEEKPAAEFSSSAKSRDGLYCYCRSCATAYQGERRAKNPELARERQRAWYAANPEKGRAKARRHWDTLSPEAKATKRRKVTLAAYGLSSEDYDEMLTKQKGRCAICGSTDPNHWSGRFHVDHDHQTEEVRGLLCHNCNSAIGHFRDNPDLLLAAVAYLTSRRAA